MLKAKSTILIRALFVIVLAVLISLPLRAAETCNNFSETFKQMLNDARLGSTTSKVMVGKAYREGKCVEKNLSEAEKYLAQAAQKGNVEATLQLALVYYDEGNPSRDFARAMRLFKQSYQRGDVNASYYIGEAYMYGKGVRKDPKQASLWLQLSARKNNDPRAHFQIGYMYQKGIKRRRNYRRAFAWYVKAALLGHNAAQMKLASFYDRGIGVRRNRIKAYTWYAIAEKHGSSVVTKRKKRLFKRLPADGIAEAKILIRRYMQAINPED